MRLQQSQKIKQQQKLSPLQIQTIKLLELTSIELEQKIEAEIEENPVLEELKTDAGTDDADNDGNEDNAEDIYDDIDSGIPSYKLQTNNNSKDDKREMFVVSSSGSMRQSLMEQLGFKNLDEKIQSIAVFLIGSIDEDGYIRRGLDFICSDLEFQQNIRVDQIEVENALKIIQSFEPAGIACRNLQECLILQLQRKEKTNAVMNALNILENYFDFFTKKQYQKIIEKLNISESDLKKATNEIVKLDPKPGNIFSDEYSDMGKTVIPDFSLDVLDGEIGVQLNSYNVPDLKINENYLNMLSKLSKTGDMSNDERETATFVKQKIDSAKCFIDAVKQRKETLMSVIPAIVKMQKNYLLSGDETLLKPMVLRDIATQTGFDVSTISRVISGKYIQTAFGAVLLRNLFSESMQNVEGEDVSNREIKAILSECIAGENKSNPLNDTELANILKSKGYKIARRTVAKYRGQLNIPTARMRVEI